MSSILIENEMFPSNIYQTLKEKFSSTKIDTSQNY